MNFSLESWISTSGNDHLEARDRKGIFYKNRSELEMYI